MIKLILDSIRKSTLSKFRILILKEEQGERYLPIWVGPCEADAILAKVTNRQQERPATYDYFRSMISYSDLKVEHAYIHSLVKDVYHAQVITTRHKWLAKEVVEMDCRPSDAILMALHFGVPIFASVALMNSHSIGPNEDVPKRSTEQPEAESSAEKPFDPYADFWENFAIDE